MSASYNGENYQAAYWTQNQVPASNSGPAGSGQPWIPEGPCGGGPGPTPTATATPTPTPAGTATPTPTPKPTATPSGTPNGKLPKHILEGYWQDFNNGAKVLTIAQVPTTYDVIAVAFANATGTPGAVDFSIDSSLGYSDSQFIADINTVHSRGQRVVISVGGQNGAISVSDSASASNFASSVHALMQKWGFDGVDIDLENGVSPSNMASALHQLASMSPGVIITMAPQTIDVQSAGSSYLALALDIQDILTVMNTQYYNSGTMLGCDGGVYGESSENFMTALACIQLQTALRPDQVGLGLPASPSGAGGGFVDPSVVNAAMDCLTMGSNCSSFHPPATWPTLRGAMTWSINWDASNGFNFANTIRSGLNGLP